MSYCIQCGGELSEGAKFCSFCRAPVKDSTVQDEQPAQTKPTLKKTPPARHCLSCGASLTAGKSFCAFCGTPVPDWDEGGGASVQSGNVSAGAPSGAEI